ncbi:MAG: NF038122 family metalloprotease [Waterburya sp.]
MSNLNTDVNFNFSFAPGVSDDQILGFEIAGDIWSQHLADSYKGKDLEINIHVEATDDLLPDNVIGGSFPAIATGIKYKKIYKAIQDDITTDADQFVADNLLDQKKIDVLVGGEVIDKNFKTHVTTANMKALGMLKGNKGKLDGYILINNLDGSLWNYDYLKAPQEGTLDFLSMAQHEIGHVLGFISNAKYTEETVGKKITNMTTMDLFRYSTESLELGINDLSYDKEAFFSIDGQESTLGLSKGEDFQVGHLAESEDSDHDHALMGSLISLAERWSITSDDLTVLDAIGWDVVDPGVIDMNAIYNNAQAKVESSQIADRRRDVEKNILISDAYNWGSSASSGGWWWGSSASSGGWWLETGGYFLEIESTTDAAAAETHHHEETHHHTDESGSDKFWDGDGVETISDSVKDYWGDNFWESDFWGSDS